MTNETTWDGVYYDTIDGDFVIFDFEHEDADDDEVVLKDAFDGAVIHWFTDEELDERQTEFREIDPFYLSDPAGGLDDFLSDATEVCNRSISGEILNNYDPIDVEFAIEALRFKRDNEAEWVSHLNLD